MTHSVRIPVMYAHRASGRARVRLADAKTKRLYDVYLGPWGSDEAAAEYERVIAQWLSLNRRWPPPSYAESGDIDVMAELADRYLNHAESWYVKNGRQTASFALAKLMVRTIVEDAELAWLSIDQFGPAAMHRIATILASQKRDDGASRYTRGTINKILGQVKLMIRFGVQHEVVKAETLVRVQAARNLAKGRHPAPGVQIPREGRKVKPVDPRIVEATLEHVPPAIAAMARVQLAAAMRPIEVCMMRPAQILETDVAGVWEYRVGVDGFKLAHMEDIERIVFLGPSAMRWLRPWLDDAVHHGRTFIFSPQASEAGRLALRHQERTTPIGYGNRPGTNRSKSPKRAPREHYTTASYARAIRRACEQHGIQHWSPNQLRHTAATRIARASSLNEARLLLGHTDVATTTIYAEPDRESAKRIAAAIG